MPFFRRGAANKTLLFWSSGGMVPPEVKKVALSFFASDLLLFTLRMSLSCAKN
jgi:hypothetical protein